MWVRWPRSRPSGGITFPSATSSWATSRRYPWSSRCGVSARRTSTCPSAVSSPARASACQTTTASLSDPPAVPPSRPTPTSRRPMPCGAGTTARARRTSSRLSRPPGGAALAAAARTRRSPSSRSRRRARWPIARSTCPHGPLSVTFATSAGMTRIAPGSPTRPALPAARSCRTTRAAGSAKNARRTRSQSTATSSPSAYATTRVPPGSLRLTTSAASCWDTPPGKSRSGQRLKTPPSPACSTKPRSSPTCSDSAPSRRCTMASPRPRPSSCPLARSITFRTPRK
mmetsp:Transcript_9734/g.27339  ORF Transcript_9734/g.27339 Transcript_9734/m.27339 type:complete len:285 (+) Transcript_9734:528-1382(+)